MTLHPVLDAEEMGRALDVAPIEDITAALVRRADRAVALAEAAFHELQRTIAQGRRVELYNRVSGSLALCQKFSGAVSALAPGSRQAELAEKCVRVADNFARLALGLFRGLRLGHA